jgi:hypothetical protein
MHTSGQNLLLGADVRFQSCLVYSGGSLFSSVRESQLRPKPAIWVRTTWRHHSVVRPLGRHTTG